MTHFTWLDYTIFAVYLLASVGIGVAFTKGQHDIKDYFLAGRTMGSVIVAISVLAALFSGISYLGAPSEVYVNGIGYMLIVFALFIATPVTAEVFLPFFYRMKFFTAYQYLEERFSVGIRTLASALFISRVVLWLSLATYAPALALEQVTGLPLWFSILVTGVLTTVYTTLGGMAAVIWTDVMQFLVLFGGQIVIVGVALSHIPGGIAGVHEICSNAGKLTLNFSLDPTIRITVWAVLLGGACHSLVQLATDQVSVQRYMTATSHKVARRSLWLKLALSLPTSLLFYSTGLVLFAFYSMYGDPIAAGRIAKGDQILPYFVITQLPMGLPGLLISAIYAASMSTISAGINSLTTATLVDFYKRLWRPDATEQQQFRIAHWLTIGYGTLVLALAFVVGKLGTLVEAPVKAFGLIGGPLLGLFLLGMLVKRANSKGAIIGWAAGVLTVMPIALYTQVSFLWYPFTGAWMTFVVGWLASLAWPPKDDAALVSLTWATRFDHKD
jgi:sodium-coupled monocarboxylate transporter 8/12